MASLRDPNQAAQDAAELDRAVVHARAELAQRKARQQRERRMKGSPAARRAIARDYAPQSPEERRRADGR